MALERELAFYQAQSATAMVRRCYARAPERPATPMLRLHHAGGRKAVGHVVGPCVITCRELGIVPRLLPHAPLSTSHALKPPCALLHVLADLRKAQPSSHRSARCSLTMIRCIAIPGAVVPHPAFARKNTSAQVHGQLVLGYAGVWTERR